VANFVLTIIILYNQPMKLSKSNWVVQGNRLEEIQNFPNLVMYHVESGNLGSPLCHCTEVPFLRFNNYQNLDLMQHSIINCILKSH
jgi:hypothetical protein